MNVEIYTDNINESLFIDNSLSHFQASCVVNLHKQYLQKPILFIARTNNKVKASWLFYVSSSDYALLSQNQQIRNFDRHIKSMHGPCLVQDISLKDQQIIITQLLETFINWSKKQNFLSISLSLNPLISQQEYLMWIGICQKLQINYQDSWTYITKLPNSIDEMLKQIKSDRRTKIRKAEKNNVIIQYGHNQEIIDAYTNLRNNVHEKSGQAKVASEFYHNTYAALKNDNVFHIFIAKHKDKVIAGQQVFAYGNYICLAGVCISDYVYQSKLPANDLLQWHVISWAIKNNFQFLDFCGAQPESKDPKINSIDSFKARWGTQLYKTLTISPKLSFFSRVKLKFLSKYVQACSQLAKLSGS